MKVLAVLFFSFSSFASFAGSDHIGGTLKDSKSDSYVALKCVERISENDCLQMQVDTNINLNYTWNYFDFNLENMAKIEQRSIDIKKSALSNRYFNIGSIATDKIENGLSDLADKVVGIDSPNLRTAVTFIPEMAGMAVGLTADAVKSPVVLSSYFIAKMRAKTSIQKDIDFLKNQTKKNEKKETSKENLLSILEALKTDFN